MAEYFVPPAQQPGIIASVGVGSGVIVQMSAQGFGNVNVTGLDPPDAQNGGVQGFDPPQPPPQITVPTPTIAPSLGS